MIKRILKRIIRQPLSCVAVCVFAAVLSFSLCFLQYSLEAEQKSFEETCNSVPIRFKITELDGSKFENTGGNVILGTSGKGIAKWALNEFLLKDGDFKQLAGEVIIRLDHKGVVKRADGQAAPTTPFSGITNLDAAEELTIARGGYVRWYEGYDENVLSTKDYVCLVPEDYEGGDVLEVTFTGKNNSEIILNDDGSIDRINNYVQTVATFTVIGRYSDEENTRVYVPYKTMTSLLDKIEISKESCVTYLGATLRDGKDLEKLREARAKWFAEPNPTGAETPWEGEEARAEYYLYAMDIEDTLLRSLEINMKNSIFLNKFASVILFILSAGAGFLTGFLIIRARKREIALRQTMGDSKASTFFEFSLEQLTCAIVGILIGGAYSLWHPLWQLVTFAIIYYIGLAIALTVFLRKNLLTGIKEDE